MPTFYLNRRSSSLSREGEHLLIKQHAVGETSQVLPLHELSSVVVVGDHSIMFPALSALIGRQVPITFLTCGGNGAVRLKPEHPRLPLAYIFYEGKEWIYKDSFEGRRKDLKMPLPFK